MPLNNPCQLNLTLPLSRDASLAAFNFFVSDSNRKAAALIDAYPAWDTAAVIIVGDKESGKTHLANILHTKDRNVQIFEDIDRNLDETALFTALNEPNCKTLITSRVAPADLNIGMADLRSRLSAQICVKIDLPDDDLIRAVVMKRLNDNGLYVTPKTLAHIVRNAERSYAFLGRLTDEAVRLAAQNGNSAKGKLSYKTIKDILTTLKNESYN